MSEKKDKLTHFLTLKMKECEKTITKRKRKNKNIKILYYTLISSAIIGNAVIVILSSLTVPPIAVTCVSAMVGILTALSIKFRLRATQHKIEKNIQELAKIKDKLDYIISCNGNITEDECDEILSHFRYL